MDFLRGGPIFGEKNGNRNRNEPEPVEPNRGFKDLGVNRTEPNRTVGFLIFVGRDVFKFLGLCRACFRLLSL